MLYLNHFDPADISPESLVDREDDFERLLGTFKAYFDAIEQRALGLTARRIVCMNGDKGSGKSILAAKLVQNLRREYSASTLFVSVDCRGTNGARGVLASIASGLVQEIDSFRAIAAAGPHPLPEWIQDLAALLSAVAHADTASSKQLHQQLTLRKAALKAGGQLMLRTLKAEFDISLERTESDIRTLEATVTFDVTRLAALTTKLFEDLRAAGMRVFLLVDNVDELQHEYWDEAARTNTDATVKQVLRLIDSPIAMLLCMRTYFRGSLPRVIDVLPPLERLPVERLQEIVDQRVARETPAVQQAFRTDDARNMVAALAMKAATPLALLNWVKWTAESREGFASPAGAHADRWRAARYANYSKQVEATLACFAVARSAGSDSVHKKELLRAIGDDDEAFRYLQTTELILPLDFWTPTHFALDPSAAWIAARG
jgi:hypothetical protein